MPLGANGFYIKSTHLVGKAESRRKGERTCMSLVLDQVFQHAKGEFSGSNYYFKVEGTKVK